MLTNESAPVSRREWLGRFATPVVLASLAGTARADTTPAAGSGAAPTEPDRERGARVMNVRGFGAKGDGATLDTAAVQAAIDACHADGGGTVLVPAGTFVVGTLELKSDITLHLAAQGRLLGSDQRADYRAGHNVPAGNGNVVLLYAVSARNITIEGPGTIDGQGAKFYTGTGDGTSPMHPTTPAPGAPPVNRDRPHLVIFSECESVRMRDVFLTASAYHCVRILRCRHVSFDGVRIYNRVNKNNDGFHFVSCEHVRVSGCEIVCQDDACALFGSNQFVTVTNCTFSTRWSIFRFGSGASQNIAVSNCLIYDTYGCPIKISAGRAQIENLSFSNIIMRNVTGPIGIGFSGRGRERPRPASGTGEPEQEAPPSFVRNISFNAIRASVVPRPVDHPDIAFKVNVNDGEQLSCITLNGMEEAYLENISFTDVHVVFAGGGTAELAAKREIPADTREYFGVWNQPPVGPPAYGLFARNVKNLALHNVTLSCAEPDLRPALVFDNVRGAQVSGLGLQGHAQAESVVRITGSKDVLFSGTRLATPAPVFLQAEGAGNENIVLDGGDLARAGRAVALARGATEGCVRVRS